MAIICVVHLCTQPSRVLGHLTLWAPWWTQHHVQQPLGFGIIEIRVSGRHPQVQMPHPAAGCWP